MLGKHFAKLRQPIWHNWQSTALNYEEEHSQMLQIARLLKGIKITL